MKNIDKHNIFNASYDPKERKVTINFDQHPDAKAFFDWLNKDSE